MSKVPVKAILDYCYKAADLNGNVSTVYSSAIKAGDNRNGYVYGGQGEMYSEAVALEWVRRGRSIPPGRRVTETKKYYFTVSCSKWYGYKVEDCSGMIINAMRTVIPKYKDQTANGLMGGCKKWGKIATIPEVPGICVWKSGHIGIYIGNGWVVECRGTDYGTVCSKLSSQKWKKWGYLADVDYGNGELTETVKVWTVTRLLKLTKPMQKGEDVTELQTRLIDGGFKSVLIDGRLKAVKADGTLGPITEAAIKAFQQSKGLQVDGKAGRNTVTALGGVWGG